jgi:hypothetical protein
MKLLSSCILCYSTAVSYDNNNTTTKEQEIFGSIAAVLVNALSFYFGSVEATRRGGDFEGSFVGVSTGGTCWLVQRERRAR